MADAAAAEVGGQHDGVGGTAGGEVRGGQQSPVDLMHHGIYRFCRPAMTIPSLIIETAEMLLKWGCDKLSGDEGFGVLMMSDHPDGNRMHNFCYEILKAHEVAYRELEEKWKDATAFVLCYDVTISLTGGLQRGFLFEAEDRTAGGRYRFFRGTAQSEAGRWAPTGEFIELPE